MFKDYIFQHSGQYLALTDLISAYSMSLKYYIIMVWISISSHPTEVGHSYFFFLKLITVCVFCLGFICYILFSNIDIQLFQHLCLLSLPILQWYFWNMYNIVYEMNHQSRFDAGYRMLGAGALGWPRGMVQGGKWAVGRGVVFRMGNMCTPMADSCWCMAKPIQYCKVK